MMITLYDPTILRLTLERLEKLQADSPRRWGQMEPAQMLAHCAATLELATSDQVWPRPFSSRLLGWLRRSILTNNTPFKRNQPTDPRLEVTDARDFVTEKARLIGLIHQFVNNTPDKASKLPHPVYGKLNATQWGGWLGKHIHHHLKQFGV